MKQFVLTLLGALLFLALSYGQEKYPVNLSFSPSTYGYVVKIPFVYKFINVYGEALISVDFGQPSSNEYLFEGKTYTSMELTGQFEFGAISGDLNTKNIDGDLYYGNTFLGRVTISNIIGFTGLADTYDVLKKVGLNAKDYKDKIGSLLLRNFKLTISQSHAYKIEELITKKEKNDNYKDKIAEGDWSERMNYLDDAIKFYTEASRLLPDEQYPKQKIQEIKEIKAKQQKEENYKSIIQKADELFGLDKYDEAIVAYKEAQAVDPDREYPQTKIDEIKNKQEEAKKKAAESGSASAIAKKTTDNTETTKEKEKEKEKKKEGEKEAGDTLSGGGGGGGGGYGLDTGISSKQQAEFERVQRVMEHNQQNMEMTQSNINSAVGASTMGIMALIKLGAIIYKGLGNDSPYTVFKGNSWRINFNVGYAYTSAPIITNSDYTLYDGNNYTHDKKSVSYQTGTFDLQGGIELWPLYGENSGAGVFADGIAGVGLPMFQNSRFGYDYGVKGFIGVPALKLYGEVSRGNRLFKHHPWIDPDESGSGESKTSYLRLSMGPMISWRGNFKDETLLHLSLLPVFELPSNRISYYSYKPVLMRWISGFTMNLYAENRLRIFSDIFWQYPRSGKAVYSIDNDAKFKGFFVRAGVLRTFDFFGNSSYNYDFKEVAKLTTVKSKRYLHFGMPAVSWIKQEKDTTFFISDFKTGLTPLGFEQEIRISDYFSAFIGGSFIIENGAIIRAINGETLSFNNTTFNTNQNVKMGFYMARLPVGIRFYLTPKSKELVWVKAGVSNDFIVANNLSYKSDLLEGKYEELKFNKNYLKVYVPSYEVGFGIDFPIENYGMFRTGIIYNWGFTNMIQDNTQKLSLRSLSLCIGVEL